MISKKQSSPKPNKGIIIAVCLISIGLIAVVVWLFASDRLASVANGGVVMVVRYEGGLCPDDPCASEDKLYENGFFDGHERVSSQELSELKQVLNQTDFLQYSFDKNAFCQSYADGQDLVVEFPGRYDNKSFRPCSLDIPNGDTSIQYVKDFIANHSKD